MGLQVLVVWLSESWPGISCGAERGVARIPGTWDEKGNIKVLKSAYSILATTFNNHTRSGIAGLTNLIFTGISTNVFPRSCLPCT